MLYVWQHDAERWGITRGFVAGDACGCYARLTDGAFEESLRRLGVAPLREVCIDDLAVLIDRPINVGPFPSEPRVGFINSPFLTDWPTEGPRGIPKQREEALDPPVDCAAISREATLGKSLHDIGVAQAIADIPADRKGDHVVREGMVGESTR